MFAATFLLSLGGGYLLFNRPAAASAQATAAPAQTTQETHPDTAHNEAPAEETGTTTTAAAPAASAEIFTKRGCVACHSVSALDVQGGVTGPDLSRAYLNVADKHGVPVEDFLKKPTSAVMSSVLGANPLTDEERAQVLSALQAASGK
ncbi:hypothetical protein DFI_16535 (plasmid) [Deinococcus ficus]|uniref:Cytochrome c domain-containing protein n=1 Tax=Deinococcus ficus TaxID=317577 RepID=A0A221T2H6_9DEIO|nr:hypothetical protein DFI_16535 [Deinococcus ficus]